MKIPYLNDYLKYLKEHNYNKSTIYSYNFGLKSLSDYLNNNNINPRQLTLQDIENFIGYLKNKKAKSTVNVSIACLKNYLYFLKKYKKIAPLVELNEIKRIKEDRRIKDEIDAKNILQKLDLIDSERDRLIIQLILKTGIRISELVKIKKTDVFKNKIKVDMLEYILDNGLSGLINDFAINNPNKKSKYLFTSQRFEMYTEDNNLTVRSVERIFKKYFNNYSYQDLRLFFYRSLSEKLPDIIEINKHKACGKIELQNLNEIIS